MIWDWGAPVPAWEVLVAVTGGFVATFAGVFAAFSLEQRQARKREREAAAVAVASHFRSMAIKFFSGRAALTKGASRKLSADWERAIDLLYPIDAGVAQWATGMRGVLMDAATPTVPTDDEKLKLVNISSDVNVIVTGWAAGRLKGTWFRDENAAGW
jgi:hypothetical protein